MTKEQAIKHLKLMQSGARNAIRFKKNDKEISEEERKEDIDIYQDQLEALDMATKALEKEGYYKDLAQSYERTITKLTEAIAERQSCDDCVSRRDTLKKFEDRFIELQKAHQMDKQLGVNWCINTLKEMPPITPTRKVGKWIKNPNCIATVREPFYYQCSICECPVRSNNHKFCSNCGAEMRGCENG